MKPGLLITCTMAALALAACKKNANGSEDGGGDNSKVTITTANPPAGGTWADVVNETSNGYMMGNPNAKVKLIEIGSLSCPHCKAFEMEGAPQLVDKYVKTGQVSWEFRPYIIHGPIDVAADLIVRCNGVKTFFPLSQALYKDQEVWLGKISAAPQDKVAQIQNLPPNQSFVQMAGLMGLQDWAAARGVPQAKSNQCLADEKMINQEVQRTSDVNTDYPDFTGTPTFIINGKLQPNPPVGEWDKLEPLLKDALK
jgi:protein-disulfide isomerase